MVKAYGLEHNCDLYSSMLDGHVPPSKNITLLNNTKQLINNTTVIIDRSLVMHNIDSNDIATFEIPYDVCVYYMLILLGYLGICDSNLCDINQ